MGKEQYGQVLTAIEYTLDQLRRGPKDRDKNENAKAYEQRVETWYKHKHRFVLFCIKAIRDIDSVRAKSYLNELRNLRDRI
jgi:hypothetical protein